MTKDQNLNYSELGVPVFLMDAPQNYNTTEANNIWMEDYGEEKRKVNKPKAFRQWLNLYNYIASSAYVITLPEFPVALQDQVFVANLGIMLHTGDFILSNFTSSPRLQETFYGKTFFDLFLKNPIICPHKFEGEAELKWLHDNVYIGGYGQRSEVKSYLWMQINFDVQIIPVFEASNYCYHLDCSIFPLTKEKTLVCTKLLTKAEVRSIAAVTDIIDVPVADAEMGICNAVRLDNLILSAHVDNPNEDSETREMRIHKNHTLERIARENAMEVVYFDLSEFEKGGAMLSCMVLHMNRHSYSINLLQ